MTVLTVLDKEIRAGETTADLELRNAWLEFEAAYRRAEAYMAKLARHAPCKCGCAWSVHQHYTASTYCSRCGYAGCVSYRKSRPWWWRLRIPFPNGELPCPHPV